MEAYQDQKREFSQNIANSNTGALILTPRWPPKCPKIGPRRLQEALEDDFLALENRLKICLVLGVDFGRFWPPKAPPKVGPQVQRSGLEVGLFLHVVLMLFWIASKTTQEAPNGPRDPPKSTPRGSKSPPRAPQEAPREPQETPRAGQEGSRPSKKPQEAPKDKEGS